MRLNRYLRYWDKQYLVGVSAGNLYAIWMRGDRSLTFGIYRRQRDAEFTIGCWRYVAAYDRIHRAVRNLRDTIIEWEQRMALACLTRSTVCAGTVFYRYDYNGEPVYLNCGDTGRNGTELCPRCLQIAGLEYPQGWDHYPGDVCPHGRYVGGCGVDWMCPRCEDS